MSEAQTNMPVPDGETLQIPLEIKTADGESAAIGTFEGYGSVFGNRDRDGDIVAPGAFRESLKAGLPALLWQHDQKSPIGRFDVVREDKRGLYVKGRLSMSGRGREAYDLLKMGALNGLSIGFVTKEASRDAVSGARTIMHADLMEVSLVTFPANELARVQAVKSQTKEVGRMENTENFDDSANDVRSFERLLRENGFSRSRAKAITAKGFRGAELDSDVSAEIAEMVQELERKNQQLRLRQKRGRHSLSLLANITWGSWKRLATVSNTPSPRVTYVDRPKIHISARSANFSILKGPFMLKIKYVAPGGRRTESLWLSNGGGAGNGPYEIAEGIQEIMVKAITAGSVPQRVIVEMR